MARIFVSYRREDSPGHTGRLYDHLIARYGAETVFRDIEAIELGEDFRKAIEEAVGACNVLLAVIGPQWLSIQDKQGKRRLDNPKDFVRLEIATALSRGIRVIPVLVNDASMPAEEELPPDVAALALRNAIEISDLRFPSDVEHLTHSLDTVLGWAPAPPPQPPLEHREPAPVPVTPPTPPPPTTAAQGKRNTLTWLLVAGGAVLAAALLILLARPRTTGEPPTHHEEEVATPQLKDAGLTEAQGGSGVPQEQEEAAPKHRDAGAIVKRPTPPPQPPPEVEIPLRRFNPGEGFTVLMPASPQATHREVNLPVGTVTAAAWTSNVEGVMYSISIADYPEKVVAARPAEEFLNEDGKGLVNQLKGTLKSEEVLEITSGTYKYPGKGYTVASDAGKLRARAYLVGPRLYTLLVLYNPSIGAPYAEAFLNSLTLINPPPTIPLRQGRSPKH